MRKYISFFLILLSLTINNYLYADVQEPIQINADTEELDITSNYMYLLDDSKTLTVSDIIKPTQPLLWKKIPQNKTSFGAVNSALWLRVAIQNTSLTPTQFYVCFRFARLDFVDAMVDDGSGTLQTSKSGIGIPFKKFTVPFFKPCASFLLSQKPALAYIRLQANGPLDFSSSLYSVKGFEDFRDFWSMITNIFLGAMAIIIFQIIIILLAMRKHIFLFFLGHIFFHSLYVLTLAGNMTSIITNNTYILQIIQNFCGAFSIAFFVTILSYYIPKKTKNSVNIYTTFNYIVFCSTLICFIIHPVANAINAATGLFFCLYVLTLLITNIKTNNHIKYLLAGFSLYLLSVISSILEAFGIIPYSVILSFTPHLGTIVESVFIGLTIMQHIAHTNKLLEKQKIQTIELSKYKSIAEMSGNITHEINTPLSIISFKIQNIMHPVKKGILDNDSLKKELLAIVDIINRITSIVHNMRLLRRDSSQEPLSKFSLPTLLNEVLTLFKNSLDNAKIKINLIIPTTDIQISARNAGIFQICSNLIKNAIDALMLTPENQNRTITIELSQQKKNKAISISVSDNGIKIQPEIAGHIFEPFFSTKPGGLGLGVGLNISQEIARAHGGSLTLDSSSISTKFILLLPQDN